MKKSTKNTISILFILMLLIMLDLRITLKVSYFYQANLNAILTEYNKGLQGYINSNNENEIRSSIRIAEQVNISELESLNHLSLTSFLFSNQNQKTVDYIRELFKFSNQLYFKQIDKNILNEIFNINNKIVDLTSEVKSNGTIKTLDIQGQVNLLIDKAYVIMSNSMK